MPGHDVPVRADPAALAEHRCAHRRGGRRDARNAASSCIDSTALLQPMLASAGVMTRRGADRPPRPSRSTFGYRMADAIAGLDIGQTDRGEAPARSWRSRRWRAPTRSSAAPATWPGLASSSSRWPSRSRTCASTCRWSASPTIQVMAPGRRDAAVARRRQGPDVRQAAHDRRRRRRRHRRRRPAGARTRVSGPLTASAWSASGTSAGTMPGVLGAHGRRAAGRRRRHATPARAAEIAAAASTAPPAPTGVPSTATSMP